MQWWVYKRWILFTFSAVVFSFEKTIVDFLVSCFLIITHRLIQLNYFWWNSFWNNFRFSAIFCLLMISIKLASELASQSLTSMQNVPSYIFFRHLLEKQYLHSLHMVDHSISFFQLFFNPFLFRQTFFLISLFWFLNFLSSSSLSNSCPSFWLFFRLFWILWMLVTINKLVMCDMLCE